ncbi:hypothetical protein E3N88_39234 [Mikania micrantha]|uniref:Protein DCL, chloroplastic n=1 Tax=Mikania micrantha TaxID=192012 RepID=A0A5N6LWE8_9ASTR|nr:hypothetical protein E3N88_45972 [Mikania micrantha]KAD2805857.1 hypothetical protein E3N88_39234 [Mikania micrantha]
MPPTTNSYPLTLQHLSANDLTNSLSNPSLKFQIHDIHDGDSSHPWRFGALKTSSGGGSSQQDGTAYGAADLLRKPVVEVKDEAITSSKDEDSDYEDDGGRRREEDGWIDWEDQILEDTVPLVGFVRMILHSSKYASGERLSPEHERTILERLLPHHPESEKKIGCGISYITVGYHPDFESSRCLFIVRKDGEMIDFSYWKCIKGQSGAYAYVGTC